MSNHSKPHSSDISINFLSNNEISSYLILPITNENLKTIQEMQSESHSPSYLSDPEQK